MDKKFPASTGNGDTAYSAPRAWTTRYLSFTLLLKMIYCDVHSAEDIGHTSKRNHNTESVWARKHKIVDLVKNIE